MCEGINLADSIQHLKRSIGKMMVYWIVHSRPDLHAELLANNRNNNWAGLDLEKAFAATPEEATTEFNAFFSRAKDLFNEPAVKAGTDRINQRVYGADGVDADWCDFLMRQCPDNKIINVMFNAAMAYVDATDWEAVVAGTRQTKQ